MSGEHARLPPGWAAVPLQDVAESWLGKMLDKAKHTSGKRLPYIRNVNVRWGHFDLSDVAEMYFDDNELERYGLRLNDVLVCEGGEPGRAAVWREPVTGFKFQKAIHRIRPSEALLPEWLVFSLKLDADSGQLSEHFTGTTIKHLTGASISRYHVRLPPANEQKRIVAKIEALQARSDAAKQALDAIPPLLEKFRQSVLAAAFRGDLTRAWREAHPDVEPASKLLERIRAERRRKWEQANPKKKYVEPEPVDVAGMPELPEGWCWTRAEELAWEITVGHVGPMKHRYVSDGVPFLRSQNVRENRFDPTGLLFVDEDFHRELPKSALSPGDLLVVRSGAPGTACVLPSEIGRANCADLVITRLLHGLNPTLAAFYINSHFARSQVRDAQVGMAQQHFNVGSMKEMRIPLMSEREQDVLLKVLSDRLDSVKVLHNAATAAASMHATLNQSILAKAFRGELVPQDPTDEPASVLLERIRAARETTAEPKRTGKRGRKPKAAQ